MVQTKAAPIHSNLAWLFMLREACSLRGNTSPKREQFSSCSGKHVASEEMPPHSMSSMAWVVCGKESNKGSVPGIAASSEEMPLYPCKNNPQRNDMKCELCILIPAPWLCADLAGGWLRSGQVCSLLCGFAGMGQLTMNDVPEIAWIWDWGFLAVREPGAKVEHEASTSKIGEDQLFYFQQRGIDEEKAVGAIISGFCREVSMWLWLAACKVPM
eukprot:scaffold11225_cov21-Tisochrysis_lutea.AAC.2